MRTLTLASSCLPPTAYRLPIVEAGESHPAQSAGPSLTVARSLVFRPAPGRASCPSLRASAWAHYRNPPAAARICTWWIPSSVGWAASCGLRSPLSSAWASCPGWAAVVAAPTHCAPTFRGGARFVSKDEYRRWVAALPHVVRGEVKGRRRVCRACQPAAASAKAGPRGRFAPRASDGCRSGRRCDRPSR